MSYSAYLICNKAEFEALELISKTYTVNLPELGQKDVLVTNGNLLALTFEGVFLGINLNSKNPFFKDGYAAFLDESNDVYLGIEDPA